MRRGFDQPLLRRAPSEAPELSRLSGRVQDIDMVKPDKSHLPDFLIIGAMKAGTTTLYRDLELHPQIFLPQEKEPETLVSLGDDLLAMAADYR